MTKILIVKIITPSKIIAESKATMVNIPGSKGMFGVLPGHVKFVSTMDIGVVTIMDNDIETKYFVYGGIAQTDGETLNIITEFANNIESTNIENIRNIIISLQNDLSQLDSKSVEADIILNNIEKHQQLLNFVETK